MWPDNGRMFKVRVACLCLMAAGLAALVIRSLLERVAQESSCPLVCPSAIVQSEKNISSASAPSTSLPEWDYNWDQKAASEALPTSTAERVLILIRHGQYHGATGKLTELGRLQANLTGHRLKAMNLTYQSISHSTMIRAVETAQIIHSHLSQVPIYPDEVIQEGGPVPPNPTVSYWKLPDRNYYVDGPRMEGAFRKYFYRPDPAEKGRTYQLLVGHGNIFRFFTLRALQLSKDAWMRIFIAHASITQIFIRADSTVAVSMFGDCGHLPYDKVTY